MISPSFPPRAQASPVPSSPGNTSLSSWESLAVRKTILVQFIPPERPTNLQQSFPNPPPPTTTSSSLSPHPPNNSCLKEETNFMHGHALTFATNPSSAASSPLSNTWLDSEHSRLRRHHLASARRRRRSDGILTSTPPPPPPSSASSAALPPSLPLDSDLVPEESEKLLKMKSEQSTHLLAKQTMVRPRRRKSREQLLDHDEEGRNNFGNSDQVISLKKRSLSPRLEHASGLTTALSRAELSSPTTDLEENQQSSSASNAPFVYNNDGPDESNLLSTFSHDSKPSTDESIAMSLSDSDHEDSDGNVLLYNDMYSNTDMLCYPSQETANHYLDWNTTPTGAAVDVEETNDNLLYPTLLPTPMTASTTLLPATNEPTLLNHGPSLPNSNNRTQSASRTDSLGSQEEVFCLLNQLNESDNSARSVPSSHAATADQPSLPNAGCSTFEEASNASFLTRLRANSFSNSLAQIDESAPLLTNDLDNHTNNYVMPVSSQGGGSYGSTLSASRQQGNDWPGYTGDFRSSSSRNAEAQLASSQSRPLLFPPPAPMVSQAHAALPISELSNNNNANANTNRQNESVFEKGRSFCQVPTSTARHQFMANEYDGKTSESESGSSFDDSGAPEYSRPLLHNRINSRTADSLNFGSDDYRYERTVRPKISFEQTPQMSSSSESPFANIGKSSNTRARRANFLPQTSVIEEDNDQKYSFYICPRCGTRQREFFTVLDAPRQVQGPASYLALYFSIYVIASLFIFGLEEGWLPLDCIYFAVITLTTAGLGDFVPTTDANKIVCSIFIYFGVACIGLLLGSYIASMMDEAAHRDRKTKQMDSCPNCARLQLLREAAANKHSSRHQPVLHLSVLKTGSPAIFMTQPRVGTDFDNRAVLDYQKRHLDHRHHHHRSHHSHQHYQDRPESESRDSPRSAFGHTTPVGSTNPSPSPSLSGSKHDLVPDNSIPPQTDASSNQIGPTNASTAVPMSPNNYLLGSPVTRNILGRQSHTRHASFDITGKKMNFRGPKPGTFSTRNARPSVTPGHVMAEKADNSTQSTLNSTLPAYTKKNFSRSESTHSEFDESDWSSSSCSTSSSSVEEFIDERKLKMKAVKYVFLTLRQALLNSLVIIVVGCLGFWLVEGFSIVDSWYFTTVLLTTVGYGDIVPVTKGGKLFATTYILVAGSILLNNMSLISSIPIELRKRRIERAVLTQFGDQLDDAALRELATGSVIQRLHLSATGPGGLEECTREMFSLAMLVRLGKVTEHDIRESFAAFRRLDINNEGVLNSKSIIAGMISKRKAKHACLLGQMTQAQQVQPISMKVPVDLPPPPTNLYWVENGELLQAQAPVNQFQFQSPEEAVLAARSRRLSDTRAKLSAPQESPF